MASDVLRFPVRTYSARSTTIMASSFKITLAGTLDGFIDMAIETSGGRSLTYNIAPDEALRLIAALHATVDDIGANCLFERDQLLDTREPS